MRLIDAASRLAVMSVPLHFVMASVPLAGRGRRIVAPVLLWLVGGLSLFAVLIEASFVAPAFIVVLPLIPAGWVLVIASIPKLRLATIGPWPAPGRSRGIAFWLFVASFAWVVACVGLGQLDVDRDVETIREGVPKVIPLETGDVREIYFDADNSVQFLPEIYPEDFSCDAIRVSDGLRAAPVSAPTFRLVDGVRSHWLVAALRAPSQGTYSIRCTGHTALASDMTLLLTEPPLLHVGWADPIGWSALSALLSVLFAGVFLVAAVSDRHRLSRHAHLGDRPGGWPVTPSTPARPPVER